MDPETMSAELEVVVVDDDAKLRDSLDVLLSTAKLKTSGFASAEDFLKLEAHDHHRASYWMCGCQA